MSDAQLVTSPHTDAESRADDRRRARLLVAAWLAGAATPPDDDLRVQPLRGDVSDDICFCSGTFCWPPVDPNGDRTQTPTHLE